jgi:hypothetical protein
MCAAWSAFAGELEADVAGLRLAGDGQRPVRDDQPVPSRPSRRSLLRAGVIGAGAAAALAVGTAAGASTGAPGVFKPLPGRKKFHTFTAAEGAQFHCAPMAPQTHNQVVYD